MDGGDVRKIVGPEDGIEGRLGVGNVVGFRIVHS